MVSQLILSLIDSSFSYYPRVKVDKYFARPLVPFDCVQMGGCGKNTLKTPKKSCAVDRELKNFGHNNAIQQNDEGSEIQKGIRSLIQRKSRPRRIQEKEIKEAEFLNVWTWNG